MPDHKSPGSSLKKILILIFTSIFFAGLTFATDNKVTFNGMVTDGNDKPLKDVHVTVTSTDEIGVRNKVLNVPLGEMTETAITNGDGKFITKVFRRFIKLDISRKGFISKTYLIYPDKLFFSTIFKVQLNAMANSEIIAQNKELLINRIFNIGDSLSLSFRNGRIDSEEKDLKIQILAGNKVKFISQKESAIFLLPPKEKFLSEDSWIENSYAFLKFAKDKNLEFNLTFGNITSKRFILRCKHCYAAVAMDIYLDITENSELHYKFIFKYNLFKTFSIHPLLPYTRRQHNCFRNSGLQPELPLES